MTTIELETRIRAWLLMVSLAAVNACGAQTSEQQPLSSETHFLSRCTDRCANDLQCIDGVCTKPCEASDACSELSASAECLPAASEDKSCQVACSGNAQCRSENEDWTCATERCVASAGSPGPGPDPDPGPGPEPQCPAFEGGVRAPVEIEAQAEPIPGSLDVLRATADETGLYWLDGSLAVFARPKGGETEMLSPARADDPSVPGIVAITGFVSDDDTLYLADGVGPDPDGPPSVDPPRPPGRVWALPKAGGEPTMVFESDSQVLYPLGVVDGEVILTDHNRIFALPATVSANERTLRTLEHIPEADYYGFRLGGERAFWRANVEERPIVLFASLAGGEPSELVDFGDAQVSSDLLVNERVLLFAPEILESETLNLEQYFVMIDLDTGCRTQLPSLGTSIGSAILDARHVYWKSFNALGGVSPGDDLHERVPYVRVNLETGTLEELVSTDFHVSLITDIVAQDADAIYFQVNDDGSLVALHKP